MFDDAQFRALLEAAPDAMVVVDPRGRIVRLNAEAERLFGFARADLLGQSIELLIPERLREPHAAHRAAYFASPGTRPMGIGLELFGRRGDGSEFPVEISLSPLNTPAGAFAIAAIRDITERKAIAADRERLIREKAAEEAASRLKDEFLAIVSHELRTPLNVILISLALLKRKDVNSDTRTRTVESLERNTRVLIHLVEDLLDVSRGAAGKLHLALEGVELSRVIAGAIELTTPSAAAKNVTLRTSVPSAVEPILGDPDRLRQVFVNLLSNAVRFTPPGGAVDVSVQPEADAVRVDVSDTGIGFDPGFAPHLFERFTQADTSSTRTHGGLGLGLAIVRQLVELHGGSVAAHSGGVGSGARFSVRLPLRAASRG